MSNKVVIQNWPSRIRDCSQGDFFTWRRRDEEPVSSNHVWVRGEYDRSYRKYWCYRFDDVNSGRYVSGDHLCFADITF